VNTMTLNWCCSVSCEAEPLVTCSSPRRVQKSALAGTLCKGAETDSRAKFGKETIAGAHRRLKWVPCDGAQANAVLRMLRLCSGLLRLAQARLRLAQAQLRYSHPQLRLKQQLLTSRDLNGTSEREN
jgi:hypothetical protein